MNSKPRPRLARPGPNAVVVTSGGILAALCGTLLSLPHERVVALNWGTVNALLIVSE
ncbi:hypothetical protein ACFY5C_39840 [Streptomyces sp. NPDC012935]|uniref:hypothetical protein n=1 Tax=Streptomyces sp. NPDC012935 TaxID=3364857 RepID=UPI003688AA89